MATLKELIEKLKEIKDTFDAGSEIADKIQEVIDRLEANEPTSLIIARILADIIEKLGENLGPLADWITAYAEAFRDAIDSIMGTLYGRYKRMRDTGFTHEEAIALITSDREVAEWLRFRYALENMPRPKPDELDDRPVELEHDDLEEPGGSVPPSPSPDPLWDAAHHDCCKDLAPADLRPVFNLIGKRIYMRGGSRYVDFEFEITHKCGLRGAPRVRFHVAAGSRWIPVPRPGVPGRPFVLETREAIGGKGVRYSVKAMQVQMKGDDLVMVDIRAVSNCIGLLAEQRAI